MDISMDIHIHGNPENHTSASHNMADMMHVGKLILNTYCCYRRRERLNYLLNV